jgi:hypothetical protein
MHFQFFESFCRILQHKLCHHYPDNKNDINSNSYSNFWLDGLFLGPQKIEKIRSSLRKISKLSGSYFKRGYIPYACGFGIEKSDDIKTEKLIWSGESITWSKDSKDQNITDHSGKKF